MAISLIFRGVKLVREALKANPELLAKAGRAIGNSKISLSGLLSKMKKNKLTTAIVVAEIASVGDDLFDFLLELMDDDPEVTKAVGDKTTVIDPAPTPEVIQMFGEYDDDFEVIQRAYHAIGTRQMNAVRMALRVPDGTWQLFDQVKRV